MHRCSDNTPTFPGILLTGAATIGAGNPISKVSPVYFLGTADEGSSPQRRSGKQDASGLWRRLREPGGRI